MFGIDSTEFLLIAVVALIVIGPKDLPRVMRLVGGWVGRGRAMTRHLRAGFDTMMREAELEEMQKQWAKQNADIMAATQPAPVGAHAYDAPVGAHVYGPPDAYAYDAPLGYAADHSAETPAPPIDATPVAVLGGLPLPAAPVMTGPRPHALVEPVAPPPP